jgi:hypothetical protein
MFFKIDSLFRDVVILTMDVNWKNVPVISQRVQQQQ